jgi:hypothetical protein
VPSSNEKAQIGDFEVLLSLLGSSLDEFVSFSHTEKDRERSSWLPLLEESLPSAGTSAPEVVELLKRTVIRHGVPIGAPGFCGWVTPTAVPAVAQLVNDVLMPSEPALFHWAIVGQSKKRPPRFP